MKPIWNREPYSLISFQFADMVGVGHMPPWPRAWSGDVWGGRDWKHAMVQWSGPIDYRSQHPMVRRPGIYFLLGRVYWYRPIGRRSKKVSFVHHRFDMIWNLDLTDALFLGHIWATNQWQWTKKRVSHLTEQATFHCHVWLPENTCFQLPDVAKQSPQCRVSHDVWHSPRLWLLVGAGFIHHDRHDLSMDCWAWKNQKPWQPWLTLPFWILAQSFAAQSTWGIHFGSFGFCEFMDLFWTIRNSYPLVN